MYILYIETHATVLVASRLEKFGNAIEEGATSASAACSDCGVGKFTDEPGQTSCTSCDPGTVTNGTGQTFCSSCAAGTKLEAGSSSCTPCELGKYTNKPGQTFCTSCDPEMVTNGMGQTFCSICDAGESLLSLSNRVLHSEELYTARYRNRATWDLPYTCALPHYVTVMRHNLILCTYRLGAAGRQSLLHPVPQGKLLTCRKGLRQLHLWILPHHGQDRVPTM